MLAPIEGDHVREQVQEREKVRLVKGHAFHEQTTTLPMLCAQCNKKVWGLSKTVHVCSVCQMAVHDGCIGHVGHVCVAR